jgi:hypothetical protein
MCDEHARLVPISYVSAFLALHALPGVREASSEQKVKEGGDQGHVSSIGQE